jgi:hypothetical protein
MAPPVWNTENAGESSTSDEVAVTSPPSMMSPPEYSVIESADMSPVENVPPLAPE